MKFRLLLILLFVTPALLFGQNNKSKNYSQLIKQIDHLNDVAYESYLATPDAARAMSEQALLTSEKIKYQLGIARSYSNIAAVYWAQSYYPIALFYVNTAIANTPPNHPLLLAELYSDIGRVYADLEDYNRALSNINKAKLLAGNDKAKLGEVFSQFSYVHMKQKEYDKAITESKISLQLCLQVNVQRGAAIAYSRLGSLYYLKRNYTAAIQYDDTAYRQSKKLHLNRLIAGMYLEYANINNDLHQYNKAIDYAKKGVALYDSIGVMAGLTNVYKTLIISYENKNDFKASLYYQKQYNHIQDSLNQIDKVRSTQLIQNYFALNARLNNMALMEKHNQDNKSKIKFQHTIITILIASLFIVLILLSVTYYYFIQKRLLSNELQKQQDELIKQKQVIEEQAVNLKSVNKLKDKLLAIVGHDLRAPIANLHNLLDMFEDGYIGADEAQRLMKEINPIVKGTELTLKNLLDWAGSQIKGQSIEVRPIDVFLLVEEAEKACKHLMTQKNIEFINQLKPGLHNVADEDHVKIILRNLIGNAIKFTGINGRITITSIAKGTRTMINITDTGTGMHKDQLKRLFSSDTHFSQLGTIGEKGTGLGLLLCKDLIELNGGKLTVLSSPGNGSTFSFDLLIN